MQLPRFGPLRRKIGAGTQAFAVGDEQGLVVRADRHGRGIPADRDEAVDRRTVFGIGDVHHHHAVVVGVGDEQRLAVRRHGDRVGRAAFRRLRVERSRNDLARFVPQPARRTGRHRFFLQRPRLNDMDRVVARARHEQPPVRRERQVVRAQADREVAHPAVGLGINQADAAAAPVADVKMPVVRPQGARMRMLSTLRSCASSASVSGASTQTS